MCVGKPGIFLCTSPPARGPASSESTVGAPHVSPARKGWEKVASEIPSAVGAIHSPRAHREVLFSLGGGSFSSHVTDETENGLQPLKSPRLLFLIFRIRH